MLNIPLGAVTRIKDIYALKGITSGIIHTSLALAIVSTVMLTVTEAAMVSSHYCTFMQRFRHFGILLKGFVVFWSIAACSFLMLPIIFTKQASWDLRDVAGIKVSTGHVVGLSFGALSCTLVLSLCASFVCSWNYCN